MSVTAISLLFEGIVAALLIVMIFYAVKLNGSIAGMRQRESELQALITSFNQASQNAEASAATLKSVGGEAERSLRAAVEKAQALRDDLVFMIERGDSIADNVERSLSAARKVAAPEASLHTAEAAPAHAARPAGAVRKGDADNADSDGLSEAERELLRAMRQKKREG